MAECEVRVNERTHMAVRRDGRCLGAVGANFVRAWVWPLYTPTGRCVLQEFPFDHPFHNGFFVGQHPVILNGRPANFWAAPPRRGPEDAVFVHVGRMDTPKTPKWKFTDRSVCFTQEIVWRAEDEAPVLKETRTVEFLALDGATFCEMTSAKTAAFGALSFPQTKYGSIGIRAEPRLLPAFGGTIVADGGRRGAAEVAHERETSFVAYESAGAAHERFGVLLSIPGGARGPWFIRDYGMALHNPTWTRGIELPEGETWTVALRIVAYDGALHADRASAWMAWTAE